MPDKRPHILVAHEWTGSRRALAEYLAHLRADLRIEEVGPDELDRAMKATLMSSSWGARG